MQEEGPTEADVSSLRSIEQRNWENLQQENAYWQEMLASTYMSRSYQLVSSAQLLTPLTVPLLPFWACLLHFCLVPMQQSSTPPKAYHVCLWRYGVMLHGCKIQG